MDNFNCKRCGNEFAQKKYLVQHLKRKTPCEPIVADIPIDEYLTRLTRKDYGESTIECEYCSKTLSNKYKYNKHLKLCKVKQQQEDELREEINELKPLKSKMIQMENQIGTLQKEMEIIKSKPLTTNTNTENNSHSHNTTNTATNSYNTTTVNNNYTISFDSPPHRLMQRLIDDTEEYKKAIIGCITSRNVKGLCKLMDATVFNPKLPENQCIKTGENGELLCHIKNNTWQKRNDTEVANKLVDTANACINNYMVYEPEFDNGEVKDVESEEVSEEVSEDYSSVAERTIEYDDWIAFLDECAIALGVDEDRKYTHIATEEERMPQRKKLMRTIINHIKKQGKKVKKDIKVI
jgi:hypothetical protein